MRAIFNQKIVPELGAEAITAEELQEYLHTAAPREAEIIVTLARGHAELAFGNHLTALPLIAQVIRLAYSENESV